jgi:glycosyltransferase involved in cell wall biosynthesis
MKILQVNKFNYPRGGADKYFLELGQILAAKGHEVAVFCMEHPKNYPSPFSKYFVSRLSFNDKSFKNILRAPGRILWSRQAARRFGRLLDDFKPDIIHCHNIYHQLSPSILPEARKRRIPVIMHVHDYKLVCPNYKLYTQGKTCFRCRGGAYYQCTVHNCYQSWPRSFLASVEAYLHNSILNIYRRDVDNFICPSLFAKEQLQLNNFPQDKLSLIYNFPDQLAEPTIKTGLKPYLLYFGRLSAEKGLIGLLEGLAKTDENLIIAGEGPQLKELEQLIGQLGLKERVNLVGFKSGAELADLIANAQAVVMASLWPENMPLSVLEALSLGRPVIASNSGGVPEIVKDGENGFLFQAGDGLSLKQAIDRFHLADKDRLHQRAKDSVANLTPDHHYQEIIKLYQRYQKPAR